MAKFDSKMAKILVECLDLEDMLNSEEEVQCLEEGNPELLEAYKALLELSQK